jgi:hypothetical protein
VLSTYRELIALRKARPELSDPWLEDVEVDVDEEARPRGPAGACARPCCGGTPRPAGRW